MSRDPRVDQLLAPLRDDEPNERPVKVDRDRVLERMDETARIVAFGSRSRYAWLGAAAAIVVLLGTAAVRRLSAKHLVDVTAVSGNVTLHRSTTETLSAGGSQRLLPAGDLTTASMSTARIHTESGLELDVLQDTKVTLDDLQMPAKALRLGSGAIRCHVPHLAPKETFSVITPDATVVVHGTVFSVEVEPNLAATKTTVRVGEGVVVVRYAGGEVELRASQSWTNVPPPESPPIPTATATESPTIEKPSKAPPHPNRRTPESPNPSPGTLDEETRLLRTGLAAERSGDLAGAAASFEELLSRYPQSPLVPDARAALSRVKARR
jgi:hypothetical protein